MHLQANTGGNSHRVPHRRIDVLERAGAVAAGRFGGGQIHEQDVVVGGVFERHLKVVDLRRDVFGLSGARQRIQSSPDRTGWPMPPAASALRRPSSPPDRLASPRCRSATAAGGDERRVELDGTAQQRFDLGELVPVQVLVGLHECLDRFDVVIAKRDPWMHLSRLGQLQDPEIEVADDRPGGRFDGARQVGFRGQVRTCREHAPRRFGGRSDWRATDTRRPPE